MKYLQKSYIIIMLYIVFNLLHLGLITQTINGQTQDPTYRKSNIQSGNEKKIKTMPFSLNRQPEDQIVEDPFLQLDVKQQNGDKPKIGTISIGIKVFPQIAGNLYLSSKGNFELRDQFLAGGGLFVDFRLSPYFSIELDLFYQAKGITLEDRKSQLFYFSALPYLKIFPAGEVFFIGFGPSIQIYTLGKIGIDSKTPIEPLTLPYGVTGGIGIQINSYPFYFSLEYRADIGISSMLSAGDTMQANIDGYPLVFRDFQIIFGIGWYIF